MIAIISRDYQSAHKWASTQFLSNDEWFFVSINELNMRKDFNVVVIESASELPPFYFEKIFALAKKRGRMK